jgi:hypothetical protein
MKKNWMRHIAIVSITLLVAGVLAAQPVSAEKKSRVTGEIVSFDLDANELVVKDGNGGGVVKFKTSKRTCVVGLRQGATQDDVSVLVGRKGSTVVVKFKDNGNGKEASYIRIKPKRA